MKSSREGMVAWKVEIEMRRGKSIFEAMAVAAMKARDMQGSQKKTMSGVWVDEMTDEVHDEGYEL